MLMGIKCKAYPTEKQQRILREWAFSSVFIWNAKCQQYKYEQTFARNSFEKSNTNITLETALKILNNLDLA
jgi:transposase